MDDQTTTPDPSIPEPPVTQTEVPIEPPPTPQPVVSETPPVDPALDPTPEPLPTPVEPVPIQTPETVPRDEPAQVPEPILDTPPASPEPTMVDPDPPVIEQQTAPEPQPETANNSVPSVVVPTTIVTEPGPADPPQPAVDESGIPPAVLTLTPEELKIAAQLYTTTHQRELSAKGVAKRQARMQANHDKIVAFLTTNSPSPLARIAYHINCSPGTTSGYLQDLVTTKRIQASGHATTRRYKI